MFGVCEPRIGEFSVTLPQDGYPKKKYYDKEMKKIAALNSMFANRIEKSSTVDWGMGGWEDGRLVYLDLIHFSSFI